jgi:hypothetical protein
MRFWVDERASCSGIHVPCVAPGAPHNPRKALPAARVLGGRRGGASARPSTSPQLSLRARTALNPEWPRMLADGDKDLGGIEVLHRTLSRRYERTRGSEALRSWI